MEVSNRKPAGPEEKLDQLQKKKQFLLDSIQKIEDIEDDMKSALWKELKVRLTAKLHGLDEILHNFDAQNVTETIRTGALGAKRVVIEILAFEEFVKSKDMLEEQLVKIRSAIEELGGSAKPKRT